jgi:hypothetical protein
MTDSVPERAPPSRFAEEPAWSGPDEHRRRVIDVLLPAAETDRERALLATAAGRRYYSDCTEAEQAVILAISERTGL